jgi:hypothetical protein
MARGKSQGIQSKNNREVGQRFGNAGGSDRRESSSYRGDPLDIGGGYNSGVAFGNTLTTNVGPGGPGTGRDFMKKAGSQGCYGPVNPGNPTPVKKTQLEDFGPDSAIVRTRK